MKRELTIERESARFFRHLGSTEFIVSLTSRSLDSVKMEEHNLVRPVAITMQAFTCIVPNQGWTKHEQSLTKSLTEHVTEQFADYASRIESLETKHPEWKAGLAVDASLQVVFEHAKSNLMSTDITGLRTSYAQALAVQGGLLEAAGVIAHEFTDEQRICLESAQHLSFQDSFRDRA